MSIFRNVVFVAALAGLVSAVVMTALQAFTTVPLILQAEVYEQSAAGEEQAAAADPAAAGTEAAAPGHVHDEEAWEPADGFERYAFTVVANIVTGIGFALILVAVSEFAGGIANWRRGLFWGLAGFAVFTLAPGPGLPPELPAMPRRSHGKAGLVVVQCLRPPRAGDDRLPPLAGVALLGVALIVAPHIVGAPQPDSFETPIPEGLHHQFVVAVTLTNLVFWLVLGAVVGVVRARFTGTATSLRDSFA